MLLNTPQQPGPPPGEAPPPKSAVLSGTSGIDLRFTERITALQGGTPNLPEWNLEHLYCITSLKEGEILITVTSLAPGVFGYKTVVL